MARSAHREVAAANLREAARPGSPENPVRKRQTGSPGLAFPRSVLDRSGQRDVTSMKGLGRDHGANGQNGTVTRIGKSRTAAGQAGSFNQEELFFSRLRTLRAYTTGLVGAILSSLSWKTRLDVSC
jgi:hypothetical protein